MKMITNGDEEEAENIQSEWVHCLGNLTLSGYNSKLSNHLCEETKQGGRQCLPGIKFKSVIKMGLH
ncbi:MAG: DUF1524 domain-containing protein [Anaerolineales bacterium]|nr:DUF1524 domain-containing protein [Anaerolineales bacterium]